MRIISPIEEDMLQKIVGLEDQLAKADDALDKIRKITWATHKGHKRAHAALSQIDQLARDGLG